MQHFINEAHIYRTLVNTGKNTPGEKKRGLFPKALILSGIEIHFR